MSAPAVTVLMAVHNSERHLRESLESILRQTLDNFEFLIVDDASTDRSRTIIDSYDDPRIRVLTNEQNLGLTRSLNIGLREARADKIARQDADDVSEATRLHLQATFLDAHPDVALVGAHYRRIDDDGRPSGERQVPTKRLDISWRLLFVNAFTHSSIMFRRSVVQELGGYNEAYKFAQDYDLWSRIAHGHGVAAVPQTLVAYRRTSGSMSSTYQDAQREVNEIASRNVRTIDPHADLAALDPEFAWRLLFGDYLLVSSDSALVIATAAAQLQHAFARSYGLEARRAARHRAMLFRTLGGRLFRLGIVRRDRRFLTRGSTLVARAGALAVWSRLARGGERSRSDGRPP